MLEKIKRQICLWLCFLFMLAGWTSVRAEEDAAFSLHARSAVLMDGDSGRILYGKEPDTPLAMASTTKIMTCILALELGSGNQICTASANAAAQPQVKLGMREAEQFYLQDLLYSLMLESHNDTAVCIAESVAGSVEAFTGKMNEKAAGIGCRDTCFLTPNGLDAGEENGDWHHTTAADLAEILRYCITESPKAAAFLKVTQTHQYNIHLSPPYPKSFIGFLANQMFNEFICFQTHQVLIRHLPFQFFMHNRLFHPFLKLRYNKL